MVAGFAVAFALALSFQNPQLTTQLVASGLSTPLYVTAPRGDMSRLFVVEQLPARIRIIKNGVVQPTPFISLSPLVQSSGEQGLLGMAFHPQYATNGYFFVSYTEFGTGSTVLARYQVSAANPDVADPASGTVFLSIPKLNPNHNGGMIQFAPDGTLYFGMGDGGGAYDPQNGGQDLTVLLGKILRIDVDHTSGSMPYAIPQGNPFASTPGVRPEIWAYGVRNPWRFDIDPLTGDLWIADTGQDMFEEVNFQKGGTPGGQNYGWVCMEGNMATGYPGCTPGSPSLTLPIYMYQHSQLPGCAIIGGVVYRGIDMPEMRGTYFFSDWCQSSFYSFRYSHGAVTEFQDRTQELTPPNGVYAVASWGEDGVGELYYCAWSQGQIYKVTEANTTLQGISYFGTGTPGCNGAQGLSANSSPVVENPIFALRSFNGPSNSLGLLLFADTASQTALDSFGLGVAMYVDPSIATWSAGVDIVSDVLGAASYPLPLQGTSAFVGLQFFAQSYWSWSATPGCVPSPFSLSSSNAVAMTILP